MKVNHVSAGTAVLCLLTLAALPASAQQKPLRIGLVGLDTSHAGAFTSLLNDPSKPDHIPGARVVAAVKGGSPDVEASATRIDKFTAELQQRWQVKLVPTVAELVRNVDAVIITSVDGRVHLEQVRPVFKARKRVFIDKPLAASARDAREIARLSRESGTPFFSSSTLRFAPELQAAKADPRHGGILGVNTWGPAPTEPHHPDLIWYGIHAVEMLYTLMGPGCVSVSRVRTDGADMVVGRWRDGRIGAVRGIRDGAKPYGGVIFGKNAALPVTVAKATYAPMLKEMVTFFQTGKVPIPPEETVEMITFMQAADVSKARQGAEVALDTVGNERAAASNVAPAPRAQPR